ncbi:MAG: methyltransferase type 12, partial [Acidobacteria bacterium]|nr:methyltransferase type 12 [Acidobacteriota bacterium]
SMIPPWHESIENALKNLKPGGDLFIVDFYDQADLPMPFQKFLKWWLKKFHVQFWNELMPFLQELQRDGSNRLSIIPLYRRYTFIVQLQKCN